MGREKLYDVERLFFLIMKSLKYLAVLTLPLSVAVSFTQSGWLTFTPLLYAFGFLPALELLIAPDAHNLAQTEAELRLKDALYDWLLYIIVPVQWGMLVWFFYAVQQDELTALEVAGRTTGMGLLCGVLGINVAHELGHRSIKYEQRMAKALLLTSQYMHFFIEHNRGHHKHVSTVEDPSSARLNEWLPAFWLRSVSQSYLSAWRIENRDLRRKKLPVLSLKNEMLRFSIIQLAFVLVVFYVFGVKVMLLYLAAATMGFLLLETVNYIEHYGLQRIKVSANRYEDAMPWHSWNSDHIIGRLMLFELSRHSDHHYRPAKKYQILDHHDRSPQMPTGYPGMMLLSLVPPLWFWVMNKKVKEALALGELE